MRSGEERKTRVCAKNEATKRCEFHGDETSLVANTVFARRSNGWVQYHDASGNPYIFHPATQTSLWGVLATSGAGSPRVGSSPSAAPSPTMQNVYNLSVSTSPSQPPQHPQPDRASQFTSPRKVSTWEAQKTKGVKSQRREEPTA